MALRFTVVFPERAGEEKAERLREKVRTATHTKSSRTRTS
jgi:hypothetical protein